MIRWRWRWLIILTGALILIVSLIYTNYLAEKLIEGERDKVQLYVKTYKEYQKMAQSTDMDQDFTYILEVIESNKTIPIIAADSRDRVLYGINFGKRNEDLEYLEKELKEIKEEGQKPIVIQDLSLRYHFYYKQSNIITLLTWFPLIQIVLIVLFVVIGFVSLNASRKMEQNRIWVGMSKETAHQLGTPISAIMGWIEVLKEDPDQEERQEIVEELETDVKRLELIADRFSKIGSPPELTMEELAGTIEDMIIYMARRAPRKVEFKRDYQTDNEILVEMNKPLFHWVLENIYRNALDAMGGEGTITTRILPLPELVIVEVEDTGKGMSPKVKKKVFEPGFSTKARGWGLGMPLAKRIIERYHGGKLIVKESTLSEGSIFRMELKR